MECFHSWKALSVEISEEDESTSFHLSLYTWWRDSLRIQGRREVEKQNHSLQTKKDEIWDVEIIPKKKKFISFCILLDALCKKTTNGVRWTHFSVLRFKLQPYKMRWHKMRWDLKKRMNVWFGQLTGRAVGRLPDWLIYQSQDWLINWFYQSTGQPIGWSVGWYVDRSTSRMIGWSANQVVERPHNWSTDRWIYRSTDWPIYWSEISTKDWPQEVKRTWQRTARKPLWIIGKDEEAE